MKETYNKLSRSYNILKNNYSSLYKEYWENYFDIEKSKEKFGEMIKELLKNEKDLKIYKEGIFNDLEENSLQEIEKKILSNLDKLKEEKSNQKILNLVKQEVSEEFIQKIKNLLSENQTAGKRKITKNHKYIVSLDGKDEFLSKKMSEMPKFDLDFNLELLELENFEKNYFEKDISNLIEKFIKKFNSDFKEKKKIWNKFTNTNELKNISLLKSRKYLKKYDYIIKRNISLNQKNEKTFKRKVRKNKSLILNEKIDQDFKEYIEIMKIIAEKKKIEEKKKNINQKGKNVKNSKKSIRSPLKRCKTMLDFKDTMKKEVKRNSYIGKTIKKDGKNIENIKNLKSKLTLTVLKEEKTPEKKKRNLKSDEYK